MAIRPLARHVPHISACWRLPPPCMRTPDRTQRVPAFHRAQVPLQRRKVSGRGRPACGRSGARTEGRVRRCRHGHAAADHPARPLEQMQGRATHAAATLPSRRRRFRGRREESAFKTIRFSISKRTFKLGSSTCIDSCRTVRARARMHPGGARRRPPRYGTREQTPGSPARGHRERGVSACRPATTTHPIRFHSPQPPSSCSCCSAAVQYAATAASP